MLQSCGTSRRRQSVSLNSGSSAPFASPLKKRQSASKELVTRGMRGASRIVSARAGVGVCAKTDAVKSRASALVILNRPNLIGLSSLQKLNRPGGRQRHGAEQAGVARRELGGVEEAVGGAGLGAARGGGGVVG